MSTENEGAANTPEAGPNPAPPAPASPPQGSNTGDAPQPPANPPSGGTPTGNPAPAPQWGGQQGDQQTPQPPSGPPPAPGPYGQGGHDSQGGQGGPPQPPTGTPGYGTPGANPGATGPYGQPASHGSTGWGDHGGGTQNPWGAPPPPPPGGPRKKTGLLVAGVLVGALVLGGIGGAIGFKAAEDTGSSTTVSADSGDSSALNRSPKSVAGIAAKALPSVVTLESEGGGESGTGTGFVFDKQGHIVTNNHVVANAADSGRLTATFSDGKKYNAEVVGRAEGYDVAVIKLKNAGDAKLTPLPLGRSGDVKVGDATIAIGAPYGLSGTVTTGIVSAKNRPVASSDGQGSKASYMSALQTDASINPGNSGGPLLNAQGAVIGVNSAIQSGRGEGGSSSGGSVGLGFAIPINQAQRVATELIKDGEAVYPVIGVQVDMGTDGGDGATVAKNGSGGDPAVVPDGPADKAGVKPGDVITKLNDTMIDSGPTLIGQIWTHKPGEKVTLTFERNGEKKTAEVTLGSRKGDE